MMRIALWAQQSIGDKYINNIDKFIKVFRITPKISLTNLAPWPVPTLKIRETGITEYQVVANCRNDLDHLRNEIINKYGGAEYNHVDLDLTMGIPDNYEAILRDITVFGDNRDAVYFKTKNFQLTSDDDFVIVYGINHERTGKAIYSNASFYGAELLMGLQEPSVQFNSRILPSNFSLRNMKTPDTIMYIKWQERLMKTM